MVDTINKIKNAQVGYVGSDGLFDSATVNAYTSSLRGLSTVQAEVALSSAGLDKAQQKQILNKLAETNATVTLTSAEASEALTRKLGSQKAAEDLLINAGLVSTDELQTGVTITLNKELLDKAVLLDKISQEEAEQILTTFGLTNANIGLSQSFSLLGKTIWTTLKPILTNPFTWAIAGGLALAGVIDYLTISYDEANEALDEANEKYKETESNISSLNDELSTNKEKIDELKKLESDGTITDSQKEELENLENKNKQVETQIALQKELLKLQNQDKAEAAKDVANAESHSVAQSVKMGDETGKSTYKGTVGTVTDTEAIKEDLELIGEYESKVSDLETELIEAKQAVSNAESPFAKWKAELKVSNIEKEIQKYKDSLTTLYTDLQTRSANAQETLEGLKLDPETNADEIKIYETALASMQEQLVEVKGAIEDGENTDNKVNLNIDTYKKASEGISALATAYKELSESEYVSFETISKIKEAVGDSISNWDEYEQKLMSVKKGTAEYKQLVSELTYATLEKQLGGVNALAQADEKYVTQLLKENGVLNANEVAHDTIKKAKAKNILTSFDFIKTTESEIDALYNALTALGLTEVEIKDLASVYASAQQAMLDAVQSGAIGRLGILKSELEGIKGISGAYDLLGRGYDVNDDGVKEYNQEELDEMSVEDLKKYQADRAKIIAYGNAVEELNKIKNIDVTIPKYSDISGSTESFKESFNWIETALSRIQQKVTHFGKTVAATWQSWKERNAALKDQMSAIRNEISLQDQAYTKYTALAESVGLSDGYKRLVENGSINIETIESESIAEAIKLYQEYYEKALAARDASADLKDELAALAQTKFSNLAQSFADLMSGNEHSISMYEATIELMEKRGYTASASLYDSLKQAELDNQGILKEKYQSLSQALDEAVNSGTVVKYSEQWYQMQNEILAVEEAILQSNIALAEYDNALRDLEWSAFDRLHEEISEIYEETEFLDKLLSDEKKFNEDGSLTDAGQAALGLDVVNYKTHLAQAEEYARELERIKEELAKDPYNQDLLDRQDELEEKHREVLTQIEDDEQSMIDTVSEGYDTLLDHMDQMIDKRKNMLSQAKDLYEYEKNISKQTQEIASLEKQLAAYQGDDSEEARATIQKLQVSLSEAKENLEETEYEKYISDQEEMLDTLRLQTEEWINARLDNEDQLLKDIVSSTEKSATEIKDTLTQVASSAGTTLSEVMNTFWSNDGDIGKAIAEIKTYVASMQKNAEEKAKEQIQNNTPASSNSGNTPATAPAPTSSTPATTSASTWGDFFIKRSDSYPKNKLNTETSIVDRLKYSNLDSSFSARSQYY